MASTEPSDGLNSGIERKSNLIDLMSRADIMSVLEEFDFSWMHNSGNTQSELFSIFKENEWADDTGLITRIGRLVYSRLALQLEHLSTNDIKGLGSYVIGSKIRSGKNSIVFRGSHKVLGFDVVLKLLRPGASDSIEQSLRLVAQNVTDPSIVMPTDILNVTMPDILGKEVSVTCLVFPYVEGLTFADFLLSDANHYNSNVAMSFIEQVGSHLLKLELAGAYHGDLHADNILVNHNKSSGLEFKLIDLSFDSVGSMSLEASQNRDLELFKQHIWSILSAQKSFLPNVSLRKFVGTNSFQKINSILSDEVKSFAQVMSVFLDVSKRNIQNRNKSDFLNTKFAAPKSFRLQRYEEFNDPSIASKLFVPFAELQEKINEFGNVFVSGNRGSGKSTYLASLGFFPSVNDPIVSHREAFGVYFPCRQGEFKSLCDDLESNNHEHNRNLLHFIILKVFRKTLAVIAEAVDRGAMAPSNDYSELSQFIERFLPNPGIIPIQKSLISELGNIVSTVRRVELDCARKLNCKEIGVSALLRAHDLIEFFTSVKATFPELAQTKFHLLYDDAGDPYLDQQIQRVINELIINSNPVFCVKLTAEKNTYSFFTTENKALENGHDYYEQDISYSLFIGSKTGGLKRERLEQYFRQIVGLRLEYFGYQSTDIRDYLGDNPNGEGRLITLLAYGRRDAYYYGWTAVWNIADRTPRNLLELVSEVFAVGNVDTHTAPENVAIRDQDRAIKTISEKRLQSLSQIAGSIEIGGDQVSLGRKLFEVTITIGSTFRIYLRAERRGRDNKKTQRIRQHLAIERNDLDPLEAEAETVLQRLETYGVLDTSRSAVARDDGAKKPIYVLNRIYCPAFAIGYRRDDHLKLSRGKFEQLLLHPNAFLRSGTAKLRDSKQSPWARQTDLFVSQLSDTENE